MISTKNLTELQDINSLKMLLKSLAVLDLIMSPEWDSRYYSYNSKWSDEEEMSSMRNGCGDEFFVLFSKYGCFIKGFDHESEMSSWSTPEQKPWPGIYNGIPDVLESALSEPAFSTENVSFCYWRLTNDHSWSRGVFELPSSDDPDGAEYLLKILDGNPSSYQEYCEEYFEEDIPLSPIREIYSHMPITARTLEYLKAARGNILLHSFLCIPLRFIFSQKRSP
jgi:hypothetical protein